MALLASRPVTSLASRPFLLGFSAVSVSIVFAYLWQFEIMPGRIQSLWGPYFVGLFGWFVTAGIACYFYRRTPVMAAEHDVDTKSVLLVAGLIGLFIVSLQLIVGIFTAFGYSPFAHSPRWILINIVFASAPVVAIELSRSVMLRTLGRSHLTLALVITSLGLAAAKFTPALYTADGFKEQAEFWGQQFIPMAATGLIAGFFTVYGGFRAGLLISLPMVFFTYLSPVLPVAPWTALALAGVAGPAMGLWIAEGLFAANEPEEESPGRFTLPSVAWVMTAVMGLMIFWFSFGFLGYRPSFIPSHSMEPLIKQGDIVLIGPIDPDAIEVGDIILYELSTRQQILHRVIEIRGGDSGSRLFITQGDNNNTADINPVKEDQVRGHYVKRVPKVGWIAIKFNQWAGAVR